MRFLKSFLSMIVNSLVNFPPKYVKPFAEELQASIEILARKMFIKHLGSGPGPYLAFDVLQPRYSFSPVIAYLQS